MQFSILSIDKEIRGIRQVVNPKGLGLLGRVFE